NPLFSKERHEISRIRKSLLDKNLRQSRGAAKKIWRLGGNKIPYPPPSGGAKEGVCEDEVEKWQILWVKKRQRIGYQAKVNYSFHVKRSLSKFFNTRFLP